MNDDALRPGEVDLEGDAPAGDPAKPAADPAPAAADPAQDPAGDPAADPANPAQDPAADPAVDPAQPAKRQPTGAVGELIALRREKQTLTQRLQAFENNPVLQRLTPEVQQAILDGRLQIQPPQSTREAERERLTEVAEKLQLFKVDASGNSVPDLDAAGRVDSFVRGTVSQAVEPVRQQTLSEKAQTNYQRALEFATERGLDVDTVREVFDEVLSQPNGAELVSQRKVAERMWETAVGRMHTRGKLPAGGGKKPATEERPPAAIITEPGGRRPSAGAAVQLSPGLQRVYKDQGLDPAKSFSSTRTINPMAPIDLE